MSVFERLRRAALAAGACAGLLLPLALSAPASADTYVMKLGTAAQHDHQTEFLERFKSAVEKDSKGRIQVQIFAGGVLGSIPRMIEDVQFGSVQGWMGTPSFLTGIDHRYELTELPIFRDPDHFEATLVDPAFSSAFLALGADKGLHGVALAYSGEAGLVLRKPVHSLADLKGLKIRCTPNAIEQQELRLLGATAVPMPLDQVLPALQQGAIDGVVVTFGVAAPLKYYSVAKYFYDMALTESVNVVTVSKSWYDKLPPDLQKIVSDDAPKVARGMYPWTRTYVNGQRKAWEAGGGEVIAITPADRAKYLSTVHGVGDDVSKGDPQIKTMYDLLLATAAKAH